MNTLSWMLYTIDVIGGIKGFVLAIGVVAGIGTVILAIALPASEGEIREWKPYPKFMARFTLAACVSWLLFILLPSSETVKLIVASEIGERLAKSEPVQEISREAYDALRNWLRDFNKEKKS